MSHSFSDADLRRVAAVSQLLLSPHDYPSVDTWRHAVNRAVSELVGADSAGFLLPGIDAEPMYSAEHPAENMQAFPGLAPPDLRNGTPIWMVGLQQQVTSMSTAYGGELHRYLRSDYYNTFAAPNGAAYTASLIAPLTPIIMPATVESATAVPPAATALQIWRDRTGYEFDVRSLAMLRLLAPSFRSGVDAVRRTDPLGGTWRVIDELGQAVIALDVHGDEVHRTNGFERLLASASSVQLVLDSIRAHINNIRRQLRAGRPAETESTIRTPAAGYDVRVSSPRGGLSCDGILLAAVIPHARPMRTDEELRVRFRLTPAEVRVARLIAEGCTSPQISERLTTSVHTVRRHTESVFRKLGVSSRSAVAGRLAE